jgi:hypothetical protein
MYTRAQRSRAPTAEHKRRLRERAQRRRRAGLSAVGCVCFALQPRSAARNGSQRQSQAVTRCAQPKASRAISLAPMASAVNRRHNVHDDAPVGLEARAVASGCTARQARSLLLVAAVGQLCAVGFAVHPEHRDLRQQPQARIVVHTCHSNLKAR